MATERLEAADAREIRHIAARAPAQLDYARVRNGVLGLRVAVVVDACAQRAGQLAAQWVRGRESRRAAYGCTRS